MQNMLPKSLGQQQQLCAAPALPPKDDFKIPSVGKVRESFNLKVKPGETGSGVSKVE